MKYKDLEIGTEFTLEEDQSDESKVLTKTKHNKGTCCSPACNVKLKDGNTKLIPDDTEVFLYIQVSKMVEDTINIDSTTEETIIAEEVKQEKKKGPVKGLGGQTENEVIKRIKEKKSDSNTVGRGGSFG